MSFFPPKLFTRLSSDPGLAPPITSPEAEQLFSRGTGYPAHHFKRRFIVCLMLSLPVLLFSPRLQSWAEVSFLPGRQPWLSAGLSALILLYGGWPFIRRSYLEILQANPGLYTFMGLVLGVGWGYSVLGQLSPQAEPVFWLLALTVDGVLLGYWQKRQANERMVRVYEALCLLRPKQGLRQTGHGWVEVPAEALRPGDQVIVPPGSQVPADGVILSPGGKVDASMLRAGHEVKARGDWVLAGAFNGPDQLQIKVARSGEDVHLEQVIELLRGELKEEAQHQQQANRVARWLAFATTCLLLFALAGWLLLGPDFWPTLRAHFGG